MVATIVRLRWPADAAERPTLARAGIARLLLVERGAPPPARWDLDEDWVGADAEPDEVADREQTLRRRLTVLAGGGPPPPPLPVAVDDDDLLWRGDRWVALSVTEAALVRRLVEAQGRGLGRDDLARAVWPAGGRALRAIDGIVRRARLKLGPLGVSIEGLPRVGYLLAVEDAPGP